MLLDDEHFHAAGVPHRELGGYFETEESGHSVAVFPILKELRYLIPFRPPAETIQFLRDWADESGERLAVLGDDGEKFGVWPDTYKTVFEEGWLREFLSLLRENREWLHLTTPARWMRQHSPRGLVYLPSLSYHEMGEWALPTSAQGAFHALADREAASPASLPFVRGGFWRNFLSKYPESNRMHKRAQDLSSRIRELPEPQQERPLDLLWQAQCNCAYWHGVFGGLYLPHLRDAIHRRLLQAESAVFEARGVDLGARELELRGPEGAAWLLHNDHVSLAVAPQRGGMLLEWGDRRTGHDLQNTLARRTEGYHARLLAEASGGGDPGQPASIHDRTRVKEAGLERLLGEDRLPRSSFQDHFLEPGLGAAEFRRALEAASSGFAGMPYEAHLGWEQGRVVLELHREGFFAGTPSALRVTKVFTLLRGDAGFELVYRVEQLEGPPVRCEFAVECNVTFLTAAAMDRWIEIGPGMNRVGMGHEGLFEGVGRLRLGDEWLNLGVELDIEEPSRLGLWPVETVSLSEDGFERNYQGTCMAFAWPLQLEAGGMREFRFEARHAALVAAAPLAPGRA